MDFNLKLETCLSQIKKWNVTKHDRQKVSELSREFEIAPIIAALLISRGFDAPETARQFLNPSFDQILDPYLLLGMKEAVERILLAVENNEKILVWGDYDVDGTTGTVV
ncbi:MAG: single-stranded-DNA-specific exonuclease RecJ, partial [Pyrinomonadaceae bacterium]|nr:single-stranded-DNA-specific exonuclease RecJ [Pyrinomonadaceae bacterium]